MTGALAPFLCRTCGSETGYFDLACCGAENCSEGFVKFTSDTQLCQFDVCRIGPAGARYQNFRFFGPIYSTKLAVS